jgi:hypothetical protein
MARFTPWTWPDSFVCALALFLVVAWFACRKGGA